VPWQAFEREASRYEGWYTSPRGRRADLAERSLLAWLLAWFPGPQRVLEVGCGTGHFTRWLTARGLRAVGLDRSPAMLREAGRAPSGSPLLLADAERLPLRDGAVDLVLLVTTLEFLESPRLALEESVRVAQRGLVVVGLNRWSLGALSRRWGPRSRSALLAGARDLSLPGLRRQLREAAGERLQALHWRSVLLPRPCHRLLVPLPCGDVIGLAAELGGGPRPGPCRRSQRRGVAGPTCPQAQAATAISPKSAGQALARAWSTRGPK
jgi:SAM-dependent methyltransferase